MMVQVAEMYCCFKYHPQPDAALVNRYMSLKTQAPPISVIKTTQGYKVVDGYHRFEVLKRKGAKYANVEINRVEQARHDKGM